MTITLEKMMTWRSAPYQSNERTPLYKSGEVNSHNKHFRPQNISGDAAIAESWQLSSARMRQMVANDPMLSKSLTMNTALVIGGGVQTFCEATDANGVWLDKFADESDEQFTEWAIEECDASKQMTFWDMHEQIDRTKAQARSGTQTLQRGDDCPLCNESGEGCVAYLRGFSRTPART